MSIPGTEGSIAQAGVNVRGGMRVFAVQSSRGVFVATENGLEVVVVLEEGRLCLFLGMRGGSPAQAWVNVKGGLRVFAVYFWHSEGWTLRYAALMEFFVKQTRTTRQPWLMACDANMDHKD